MNEFSDVRAERAEQETLKLDAYLVQGTRKSRDTS